MTHDKIDAMLESMSRNCTSIAGYHRRALWHDGEMTPLIGIGSIADVGLAAIVGSQATSSQMSAKGKDVASQRFQNEDESSCFFASNAVEDAVLCATGTFAYAAPELLLGGPCNQQVDMYR